MRLKEARALMDRKFALDADIIRQVNSLVSGAAPADTEAEADLWEAIAASREMGAALRAYEDVLAPDASQAAA